MNNYDILILTLILIGMIMIIVSFFFVKKGTENQKKEEDESKLSKTPVHPQEAVTYDEVREKILQLNEYGEFLRDEMDKKHKELLFLYEMIIEKERAIVSQGSHSVDKKDKIEDIEEEKSKEELLVELDTLDEMLMEQGQKEELDEKDSDVIENFNQRILEMAQKGLSSKDIAKSLNIGKGQVELVLNLYK